MSTQTPASATRSDEPDRCWLPLPVTPPFPVQFHAANQRISGCIRPDEVIVHAWPGFAMPPLWTPRGSVQWKVELLDARMRGPSMRLLVRPQWTREVVTDKLTTGGVLGIYLNRWQWREIQVPTGQPLLLEIGPEAIHWFESPCREER